MRTAFTRAVARAGLLVLAACSGGDGGTGPAPTPIVVAITPARDTLTSGTVGIFHASVTGSSNTAVVWSLLGGVAAGNITGTGLYTAGSTPGTYRIVATSSQNGTSADTAQAQVVAAPSAVITAPDSAYAGVGTIAASVSSQSGVTYSWAVTGGAITTGQNAASVTVTSATPGTVTVRCTVTNLADSAVTGLASILVRPAPPPPSIISWSAARAAVTEGQGTTLTATFANGTGMVDHGVGAVTSGVPVAIGALSASTTFTLTVTGFQGQTASAPTTVSAFAPPQIDHFDPFGRIAPIGGSGLLSFWYYHQPGTVASIDGGIGALDDADLSTLVYPTPSLIGTTKFTATVRNGADSAVTDTATILAVAPAPGTFTMTGSLNRPRTSHLAVSLNDGRVLVLGGDSAGYAIQVAELYNPATGTFATLAEPWGPVAAFRLSSGSVLVLGGATDNSTALFDPATGLFTARASMPAPGDMSLSALLADGRILVAAGYVYNPSTDSWAATGSPLSSNPLTVLIPLLNGRALGIRAGDGTAEVWDPATGQFSATGSMTVPRTLGSFTRLADGRVLAVGGTDGGAMPTAEIYSPATGAFTATGPLALKRFGQRALLRNDGTVLILGGGTDLTAEIPFSEVYNPSTASFKPLVGTFVVPRGGDVPAVLLDGRVLITGGVQAKNFTPQPPYVPQAELFQ